MLLAARIHSTVAKYLSSFEVRSSALVLVVQLYESSSSKPFIVFVPSHHSRYDFTFEATGYYLAHESRCRALLARSEEPGCPTNRHIINQRCTTAAVVTNRYLLEEHLLDMPQARPELEATLRTPQALLGPDEFEHFPRALRPQKHCTIVGGVGARSFLHRSALYE